MDITKGRRVESGSDPGEAGFERVKKRISGKLRRAADTLLLPRAIDSASNELSRLGFQARGWVEAAADQIERADPVKIEKEIAATVQRNPGTSLLIAASAGLLFGVIVRRK
jgi:ElaB/YqjD/DUF883 family membrane-anchored ribosome-binding protein